MNLETIILHLHNGVFRRKTRGALCARRFFGLFAANQGLNEKSQNRSKPKAQPIAAKKCPQYGEKVKQI
ncbi:MAG: hypothetical protein ACJASV_001035 [Pseudorhodobacter sp.]